MKIAITGRQIEVTPALRGAVEKHLAKLTRFLDEECEAHVILTVEKRRHRAEVVVHDRLAPLSASAETGDMYDALGRVAERLLRQAGRRREKIKTIRKRLATRESPRRMKGIAATPPESPRVIPAPSSTLKPMSVEDAILQVRDTDREFLVFRNSASRRISVLYRRKDGNYGLIEPEG